MHKRRIITVGFLTPLLSCAMAEAVKIGQPSIADHTVKPNTNFYQTKIHRRKKGGKINFR